MLDKIAGAGSYLFLHQTLDDSKVMIHTHVHDRIFDSIFFAQDIDGGSPTQEVLHHLGGHLSGVKTHPGQGHSMISSKGEKKF